MGRLGTKAETLKLLYEKIENAKVLPVFDFTVADWKKDKETVLNNYANIKWNNSVIVRSSSMKEDTQTSSMAGKYESVANIHSIQEFEDAVRTVIRSYGDENGENQILVQPMLEDVSICGVAFTLEPSTRGNYYVINYDETGSTSAITSGNGENNYLYYLFKDADATICPQKLRRLISTLKELEIFF